MSTTLRLWQIGLPPHRLDVLTGVRGAAVERAWDSRVLHRIGVFDLAFRIANSACTPPDRSW